MMETSPAEKELTSYKYDCLNECLRLLQRDAEQRLKEFRKAMEGPPKYEIIEVEVPKRSWFFGLF